MRTQASTAAPDITPQPIPPEPVRFGMRGRALPEPPRRKWLIRVAGILASLVSLAYLSWRAFFTLDSSVWLLGGFLLALEIHHALGLYMYTFALWDVDPIPGWEPVHETDLRLAILIPTYDEPAEVLLPVVATAMAISPVHETWVLDDGARPEIRRLAEQLGAEYMAREDNVGAKAGNLNNALQRVTADLVAVVDADHVVAPDFFRHTLWYFDDPAVAVVQTPQDFYNVDSFEHVAHRGSRFSEQSVFYRVILPAKNRWDAGFWCGTNAVVRTSALRDVGGVATDSVTEDIHTSIRLHRRGWRILVHNEVLARGLAATAVDQYLLQRRRWARGAMQVMRAERPFTAPGLTVAQRLAYASTLAGWFDGWRSLGYIVLPMLVIATGASPIAAPLSIFAPLFAANLLMQLAAFRLLARGHYPPLISIVFETLRLSAVLPATLELIKPGTGEFGVTPKGRTSGDDRDSRPAPTLLVVLLVLGAASLVWFGATAAGLTPLTYGVPGAVYGAVGFLVLNLGIVIVAAHRARAPRFAGERRGSWRFPSDVHVTMGDRPARLGDISLGGARIEAGPPLPEIGETVELQIPAPDLRLKGVIRAHHPPGAVGIEFDSGQEDTISELALWLFHDGATTSASLTLAR